MPDIKLNRAIPILPTGDIEKTASFFETKLGFSVVARYPTHLIVRRGEAEIHFWKAAPEDHARALGSESACYVRVENVRELEAEFKAAGVSFRYELTVRPWGMNEMQIDDPYGNAIRFGERVN